MEMTNKQLVSSFNAWTSIARPQRQEFHWNRITHNLFRYYDERTNECAFAVIGLDGKIHRMFREVDLQEDIE